MRCTADLGGKSDLHVHSVLSPDGHSTIAEHCAAAIKLGLAEIAFTEHADFHPDDPSYLTYDPQRYAAEIAHARQQFGGQLTIRQGIEVSVHPSLVNEARAAVEDPSLDLVIGAVHVVDGHFVWEGYFESLGLEEGYRLYFDEVLRTLDLGFMDIMGHLDFPARSLPAELDLRPIRARQAGIDRVLPVLLDLGVALELNTSGLRRPMNRLMPDLETVRRLIEMGGRITLGSDAHRADDLACCFDTVLPALRRDRQD